MRTGTWKRASFIGAGVLAVSAAVVAAVSVEAVAAPTKGSASTSTSASASASASVTASTFEPTLTVWAKDEGFKLTANKECDTRVEGAFGGKVERCWFAKKKKEVEGLHPRMDIAEVAYADEAAAKERVAKLHSMPHSADGPLEKAFPLRAAFRRGNKVVMITTDAFAFVGDVDRAATELARRSGGTDVTCWSKCTK